MQYLISFQNDNILLCASSVSSTINFKEEMDSYNPLVSLKGTSINSI